MGSHRTEVAPHRNQLDPPTATTAVRVRGLGPRANTAGHGTGGQRPPSSGWPTHRNRLDPPTATAAVGVRGLGPRANTAGHGAGGQRPPSSIRRLGLGPDYLP